MVRCHLTKALENDNLVKWRRAIDNQIFAGVAELADAPDLGSGVPDVQVQVLSPALNVESELSFLVEEGSDLLFTYRYKGGKRMAYLFVHFSSDSQQELEHIWFSVSEDGLHWRDLGQGDPVITSDLGTGGIRDPFMVYDGKLQKYFIIATDLRIGGDGDWRKASYAGSRSLLVWESADLINWSKGRLIEVGIEGAGCVWAPEAVYCKEEEKWFVFWASMVQEETDTEPKQRIYGAFTQDFQDFTPAFKYIEAENHVIDTDIVWADGWYYRFSKDETSKRITLERCRSLIPQEGEKYLPVYSQLLSELEWVEGPECYYLRKLKKWCLIVDRFGAGLGYMPVLSADLSTGVFERLDETQYDMGTRKKRHGGVIEIEDTLAQTLVAHYGY